jgi:hypothetical protein
MILASAHISPLIRVTARIGLACHSGALFGNLEGNKHLVQVKYPLTRRRDLWRRMSCYISYLVRCEYALCLLVLTCEISILNDELGAKGMKGVVCTVPAEGLDTHFPCAGLLFVHSSSFPAV